MMSMTWMMLKIATKKDGWKSKIKNVVRSMIEKRGRELWISSGYQSSVIQEFRKSLQEFKQRKMLQRQLLRKQNIRNIRSKKKQSGSAQKHDKKNRRTLKMRKRRNKKITNKSRSNTRKLQKL